MKPASWPARALLGAILSLTLLAALAVGRPAPAQDDCSAPAPVCAARAAVFPVSSFNPVGSSVRIGPDLLVTNRHIVADNPGAIVSVPDGGQLPGRVLPSAYPGDLVLLRVEGMPEGPVLTPAPLEEGSELFTVGADVASRTIRAYEPGHLLLPLAAGKPLARLHHSAQTLHGNSGGALLDAEGRLVGIATSGGQGRFEAIPAGEIERMKAMSGPDQIEAGRKIGTAYAECTGVLDSLFGQARGLDEAKADALIAACRATGNRQFLDLAGQSLGRAGYLTRSLDLFEEALAEDPNAVNSRLGLVVTLMVARRYADVLPQVARLIEVLPTDPQVLRFAIQAGKWGGDRGLAERALALMDQHHPKMAPRARSFLESDIPAPAPLPAQQ